MSQQERISIVEDFVKLGKLGIQHEKGHDVNPEFFATMAKIACQFLSDVNRIADATESISATLAQMQMDKKP